MPPPRNPLPDNVAAVIEACARLVARSPHVVAVGLVGSWARASGRPDSDVDLVVLSTDTLSLLRSVNWFTVFHPLAQLIRCEDFGAVQERRLRLPDGLVVEVGVAEPSWADLDPVDAGTWRVVADGLAPVYDPSRLLADLVHAVARGSGSG